VFTLGYIAIVSPVAMLLCVVLIASAPPNTSGTASPTTRAE